MRFVQSGCKHVQQWQTAMLVRCCCWSVRCECENCCWTGSMRKMNEGIVRVAGKQHSAPCTYTALRPNTEVPPWFFSLAVLIVLRLTPKDNKGTLEKYVPDKQMASMILACLFISVWVWVRPLMTKDASQILFNTSMSVNCFVFGHFFNFLTMLFSFTRETDR